MWGIERVSPNKNDEVPGNSLYFKTTITVGTYEHCQLQARYCMWIQIAFYHRF